MPGLFNGVYKPLLLICLYCPEVPRDPPQQLHSKICQFNFKELLNNTCGNARIILSHICYPKSDFLAALCIKVVTFPQRAAFWSDIPILSGPKRFLMDNAKSKGRDSQAYF
jgi:hypothetical protein